MIAAATDIAVLASANEGTPVSLIEAAAAGRPAVATRVGGVTDVVTPETGIVVEPGRRGRPRRRDRGAGRRRGSPAAPRRRGPRARAPPLLRRAPGRGHRRALRSPAELTMSPADRNDRSELPPRARAAHPAPPAGRARARRRTASRASARGRSPASRRPRCPICTAQRSRGIRADDAVAPTGARRLRRRRRPPARRRRRSRSSSVRTRRSPRESSWRTRRSERPSTAAISSTAQARAEAQGEHRALAAIDTGERPRQVERDRRVRGVGHRALAGPPPARARGVRSESPAGPDRRPLRRETRARTSSGSPPRRRLREPCR